MKTRCKYIVKDKNTKKKRQCSFKVQRDCYCSRHWFIVCYSSSRKSCCAPESKHPNKHSSKRGNYSHVIPPPIRHKMEVGFREFAQEEFLDKFGDKGKIVVRERC